MIGSFNAVSKPRSEQRRCQRSASPRNRLALSIYDSYGGHWQDLSPATSDNFAQVCSALDINALYTPASHQEHAGVSKTDIMS